MHIYTDLFDKISHIDDRDIFSFIYCVRMYEPRLLLTNKLKNLMLSVQPVSICISFALSVEFVGFLYDLLFVL